MSLQKPMATWTSSGGAMLSLPAWPGRVSENVMHRHSRWLCLSLPISLFQPFSTYLYLVPSGFFWFLLVSSGSFWFQVVRFASRKLSPSFPLPLGILPPLVMLIDPFGTRLVHGIIKTYAVGLMGSYKNGIRLKDRHSCSWKCGHPLEPFHRVSTAINRDEQSIHIFTSPFIIHLSSCIMFTVHRLFTFTSDFTFLSFLSWVVAALWAPWAPWAPRTRTVGLAVAVAAAAAPERRAGAARARRRATPATARPGGAEPGRRVLAQPGGLRWNGPFRARLVKWC